MYDLLFVKRRRRRKIAALVAFISSLGVTSLVIISFLGRSVGTFTVALSNSEVKLALVEKEQSTNYSTYLLADCSTKFIEHSFDDMKNILTDIDSENTQYNPEKVQTFVDKDDKKTKTTKCIEFFKYTFYVKNIGSKTASYKLTVNIGDRTRADDNTGRTIDDTLRVMVFENEPSSGKHDYEVYAKKAAENSNYVFDETKNEYVLTDREFISSHAKDSTRETEDYRLATNFKDGATVAEYEVNSFYKNDMKRYTVVIWLEGKDPQSTPDTEPPEGATLKLGVDIAAHEDEQDN